MIFGGLFFVWFVCLCNAYNVYQVFLCALCHYATMLFRWREDRREAELDLMEEKEFEEELKFVQQKDQIFMGTI